MLSTSCLVTLFGYKLAAKPADKDHPFGHGRMEYLTSLVIAVMIALMGFELLRNSAEKILHPEVFENGIYYGRISGRDDFTGLGFRH